jgi:hypothetical protein
MSSDGAQRRENCFAKLLEMQQQIPAALGMTSLLPGSISNKPTSYPKS